MTFDDGLKNKWDREDKEIEKAATTIMKRGFVIAVTVWLSVWAAISVVIYHFIKKFW